MAEWFEVYDAKGVLVRAQRRSSRLMLSFALVSGCLIAIAPVATFLLPYGFAVALGCAAGLVGYGIWVLIRLGRIYRRVWRLDLSVHRALGFDAGRRSRIVAWPNVHHVDVRAEGLTLVGRTHGAWVRLQIPASFPNYVALAHRVVEYAEAHHRPIWVEGQPLHAIDLTLLDPSLSARRETV